MKSSPTDQGDCSVLPVYFGRSLFRCRVFELDTRGLWRAPGLKSSLQGKLERGKHDGLQAQLISTLIEAVPVGLGGRRLRMTKDPRKTRGSVVGLPKLPCGFSSGAPDCLELVRAA